MPKQGKTNRERIQLSLTPEFKKTLRSGAKELGMTFTEYIQLISELSRTHLNSILFFMKNGVDQDEAMNLVRGT